MNFISKFLGAEETFTTPWASQFLSLATQCGQVEAMKMILRKHALLEPKSVKRYAAIVDFTQHSSHKRMYVLDAVGEHVEQYYVAHGAGSAGDSHDGYAHYFSNVVGSGCSSLGVYKVTTPYQGKHGLSCKLVGLDKTNSNAEERAVVLHGCSYAEPEYVARKGYTGCSLGCPAVAQSVSAGLVEKLKYGSYLIITGVRK